MKKKTASCFGVRKGGIRRNARIRVAGPVDMGIDFCALAAEVGKFVSAEEPCQERPPIKSEDRGTMRNARPVDLGIDPDMLAGEVAEFVAAAERRQPCERGRRGYDARRQDQRSQACGPHRPWPDRSGTRRTTGVRRTAAGGSASKEGQEAWEKRQRGTWTAAPCS
jgi:hypothetical protein